MVISTPLPPQSSPDLPPPPSPPADKAPSTSHKGRYSNSSSNITNTSSSTSSRATTTPSARRSAEADWEGTGRGKEEAGPVVGVAGAVVGEFKQELILNVMGVNKNGS